MSVAISGMIPGLQRTTLCCAVPGIQTVRSMTCARTAGALANVRNRAHFSPALTAKNPHHYWPCYALQWCANDTACQGRARAFCRAVLPLYPVRKDAVMAKVITHRFVEAVRPKAARTEYPDAGCPGLYLMFNRPARARGRCA